MGTAFLPRCRKCGSAHPLAVKGADPSRCTNPTCDEAPARPQERLVPAALTLPAPIRWIADLLGSIGAALHELARKVEDDAN